MTAENEQTMTAEKQQQQQQRQQQQQKPRPPTSVAEYKQKLSVFQALSETVKNADKLYVSSLSSSAGWGVLISSALTYHRYRHLLSSGAIEKAVESARSAIALENVNAGQVRSVECCIVGV